MFDERHLQLASSYAKASDYFVRQVIEPLLSFLKEKIKEEWNNEAHIEIGKESYVLKSDGDGGYYWTKVDPLSNELVPIDDEEQEEVEDLLQAKFDQLAQEFSQQETNTPKTVEETSFETTPSKEATPPTSVSEPDVEVIEVEVIESSVSIPAPSHIDQKHWEELVEKSAIDPEIAKLNFKSLHYDSTEQSHEAWGYLIYSDQIERKNTGVLTDKTLRAYAFLDETDGWWCKGGVDARSFANLQPPEKAEQKLWGSYKPDNPRPDAQKPGKFIKYEHPYKEELSIFLLDVPDKIAQQVYAKAGVDPSESDRASGFWYSVWKYNIPVTITEGAKKAASILSQGEAAIGLPGINAAYRSKDEHSQRIPPELRPEIAVFATPGREIKICFDHDTKSKTVRSVNHAISTTGRLLTGSGVEVKVIDLPGPEKGVDDFIVSRGASAYQKLSEEAKPLEIWQQNNPPLDLRFVVFLKNGHELRLFDKTSESQSSVDVEDVKQENHSPSQATPGVEEEPPGVFKSRSKPQTFIDDPWETPQEAAAGNYDGWIKKEEATIYHRTLPRILLEKEENQNMALAAQELLKKYGVPQKDGSVIYRSDAFTIKNEEGITSIYRRQDENLSSPLMRFHISPNKVNVVLNPSNQFLPIERQEFLMVFDSLKENKLPSIDEDPRKIANSLSSLSPAGTHKVLESFRTTEVLKILMNTLENYKTHDLELGNYRINYSSQGEGTSHLKLIKTEYNGTQRDAVNYKLTQNSEGGFDYEVESMAITPTELDKLRILADKLQINTKFNFDVDSNATRDIPVRVHSALEKNWTRFIDSRLENSENSLKEENIPQTLPAKLTINEQCEIYDKMMVQAKEDVARKGKTEIVLPSRIQVINDLKSERRAVIDKSYIPTQIKKQRSEQSQSKQSDKSREIEF